MPVPDPLSSLAEPLTDESSRDGSSNSSDEEEEDMEVVSEVVRANAPTEGITFNGSIHYRDDLNHSHSQFSRGRGLPLWKRPTIIPREPSPVELIYEMGHKKHGSHSSVNKSSSPAKSSTSTSTSNRQDSETNMNNNTRARSGSVSSIGEGSSKVDNSSTSDSRNRDTIQNSETTQPLKAMSKPSSTAPDTRKPPARVQEEASRKKHPFLLKPELGPARRPSSVASTRVPEGGNRVPKPIIESISRPPIQTVPKAAAGQSQTMQSRQPQPHNPSSSIPSQSSLRPSSQSAPTQTRPSSVFKPPNPPPGQPNSQAPSAHVYRETKVPPSIVGRNIANSPLRPSQPTPLPTSGQVNGPPAGPQVSNNPAKTLPPPIRPVVQPIRSGLLLSKPTPSRFPPSQPSPSGIPQPLATTTLPSRPPQPESGPQPQAQMSTSQSQAQVPTSVVSISSGASQSPAPHPEAPNLTVEDIESKLEAITATLGEDHARYVEYLLDEAEQMAPGPRHLSDFDAFADMPALSADTASVSKGEDNMAFKLKVHHGDNGKPKAPTKSFELPAVKIKTDKEAVPKYRFHHTEIKKNMLVPNTMLLFVPHLRDVDPNSEQEREYINWLNELDKLDKDSGFKTENRKEKFHKRIRDEIAATLSMYIEPWLKELGIDGVCSKSHLIRYMVSQEENKEHITPALRDAILSTCKENTDLTPEAEEAARKFILAFNNVYGNNSVDPDRAITLRDVLLVEKRETVVDEKRAKVDSQAAPQATLEEDDELDKNELVTRVEASLSSYAVLGCNICFTHDCEHGDIDVHNYHRTFSLDTIGGVVRALKRKWTNQVASMGGDEDAVAATSKKPPQHLPCQNACYRHYDTGPAVAIVTAWADSEVSVLEDMFLCVGHSQTLKPQCIVATILGRKCWEVYRKIKELGLTLPHVSPPQPKPAKVKPLPWYDRRRKCLMSDWSDQTSTHEFSIREIIDPCFHDGPCTKENPACPCANASPRPQLCDRFCHCTVDDCALKFTGCACHSLGKTCIQRQKEGKPCICIMLNRECDPVVCKGCGAKERADPDNAHDEALHSTGCQNVSLQRGVSKTVLLGKSQLEGCGYGLFTAEDIAQDDFVIEYTGELISHDEGVRREARRGEGLQGTSSYLFTLLEHEGIWVDAAMYGNLSRYINHASESDKKACNITPKIVYVNNEYRIKFTALRDIKAGEELFFNYGDNFPNLTKKLLRDNEEEEEEEEEEEPVTATTTTKRGRRGRPAGATTGAIAQGTARKATTKPSATAAKTSTAAKGKATRRGIRKTAMTKVDDIPPSDDDEDETWIKDPDSVPSFEGDDYEDEDSWHPTGKKRKRRGGKRVGAGRKKGRVNPEGEGDAGGGGEGVRVGEREGDGADEDAAAVGGVATAGAGAATTATTTRRTRAVLEISDSQAERDDDDDDEEQPEVFSSEEEGEGEGEDEEEDGDDAVLPPSKIVTRRKRQLRTTTIITTDTFAVGPNRDTSSSASAYTTAEGSAGSTPAPSQPGDGSGDGSGSGSGSGDGAEGTEEQGKKPRSNRGGSRPGAGRKPTKRLRLAKSGSSESTSASASASKLTTGMRQWDRLKAGIASGSGSASGSGFVTAYGSSSVSGAVAGPSTTAHGQSPATRKGKRKADEADVHSTENFSASASASVSEAEAEQSSPTHISKRPKTTKPTTTGVPTRASRAAAKALLASPAIATTMKIKPSAVSVTRSPRALNTTHQVLNATAEAQQAQIQAQAQVRGGQQSLRTGASAAAAAAQAHQKAQLQRAREEHRSSLYHTAANFQPVSSENSEDDGKEEDEGGSGVSGEDGDGEGQDGEGSGSEEEDSDEDGDGDVDEEDADNGDDEAEGEGDAGDDEVDEDEEEFEGFDSEPEVASGSVSRSADEGDGDGDDGGDDGDQDDQSPLPSRGLRSRRPQASSPSSSTATANKAPVVGGKVLRQRSNQAWSQMTYQPPSQSETQSTSQATSQSQSQSQSQSRAQGKIRGTRPTGGTKNTTTTSNKTERVSTRSSNSGKSSSSMTRSTSQSRPKASSSSSISKPSKGSSSKPSTSTSKQTRQPSVNIDKRSLRGAKRSSDEEQEAQGSRKRQKPLRYRNEEE